EPPVDEHRVLALDRFDLAVWVRKRDGVVDTRLLVPRPVDKADRGGVGAIPAVHAGDPLAANHELVDMRGVTKGRSPSAAPVVGAEARRWMREQQEPTCYQHSLQNLRSQTVLHAAFITKSRRPRAYLFKKEMRLRDLR